MDLFFSVIIPTYNRGEFLSVAIDSVLRQSFKNWELIIIDDGSSDNTKEVISKYNDRRIKYHYQENQERSAARNKGVELSTGEWICFLDSDDYYLDSHLSEFYSFIRKTEVRKGLLLSGHLIEVRKNPFQSLSFYKNVLYHLRKSNLK